MSVTPTQADLGLLRAAFDASGAGIAIVAPDGSLSHVNRAFCELTGHSREELEGGPLARILVAEDAESLRSLIHDFLSQLGYTVLQAANGSDAMYLAQNHKLPIDLLLTDIVMPGMSGRELAQKFVIKYPAAKVLYMSGYTDDTIVRHGIEEGAVALLTKPFTMEAIARKVREVLQ